MLLEQVGDDRLVLGVYAREQVDAVAGVGGVELQGVAGGHHGYVGVKAFLGAHGYEILAELLAVEVRLQDESLL